MKQVIWNDRDIDIESHYEATKRLPYPANLYFVIFNGVEQEWVESQDAKDGLEKALSGFTQERQDVIRMRYKEKLTYGAIADRIGKTTNRVRQIEDVTLKHLGEGDCRSLLLNGAKGHERAEAVARKNEKEREEEIRRNAIFVTLSEMYLSTRVKRCLQNAGYDDSEAMYRDYKSLRALPGIGAKAFNEIRVNLNRLGYLVK